MAHVNINGKFMGKTSRRPTTATTKKKPTGRRQTRTAPATKRVVLSALFSFRNLPYLLGAVVEFLSSLCGEQFLDT